MPINTKYRTDKPEMMDDFTLKGVELHTALDKIAKINHLLGGNKLTLQGVRKLISKVDHHQEIIIADLGCGNGDMLRTIAEYGHRKKLKFKLIGVDANAFTVNYAKELSVNYKNIEYHCENIFGDAISQLKYDIVLLTLTLHHFKDHDICELLTTCHKNASIGIVVNDLHRSSVAYRLFQGICFIFRLHYMSREDGLTSILRGFKKKELIPLAEKLNFKKYKIQWKWAFRYQWIISKV